MPSPDAYVTLYGPWTRQGSLTVPEAAVALFLGLVMRGFDFREPEPGKLIVTPPTDADGHPVALTEAEREWITRFKLHILTFIAAGTIS